MSDVIAWAYWLWELRLVLLHTAIVVSVAILEFAAVVKALHFIREMVWILTKGSGFAKDVEAAIAASDHTKLVELVANVRRKTHVIMYWFTHRASDDRPANQRAVFLVVDYVYRMPVLIGAISTLGYLTGTRWVVVPVKR